MAISTSSIGCGAGVFYGMYGFYSPKNPELGEKAIEDVLYSSIKNVGERYDYGILLFGDGVKNKNGAAFAEYVTKYNLGEVTPSKIVSSPLHTEKTHEGYQMWIWYVDIKALKAWYEERKEKQEAKAKAEMEEAKKRLEEYNKRLAMLPPPPPPKYGARACRG